MDIKRIIATAGGARSLATKLGLTRTAIVKWRHVPAAHVPIVAEVTGLTRHALRPDLWEPLPILAQDGTDALAARVISS